MDKIHLNEDISEVIGFFLGDGCYSKFFANSDKRWREEIQFTGNGITDKVYYFKILAPIISNNFKTKARPFHRQDDNSLRYIIRSKILTDFVKTLGINPGQKSKTCKIPKKILDNNSLVKACIRGIFNSDGSVYSRYSHKYNKHKKIYCGYAVVQFKLCSKKIIKQIAECLSNNNIKTNIIIYTSGAYVLRITSQVEVDKFFKYFKINHPYHMQRYKTIREDSNILLS